MLRFVLVRVAQTIPLLLGVLVISFILLELTPGDPLQAMVGDFPVPDAYRERITAQYNLDGPLWERFFSYLWNLCQGDLGYSFASNQPVTELLMSRIPNTLILAVPSIVLAGVFGAMFGTWSATSRVRGVDSVLTIAALSGFSIPIFWLGQILVAFFALRLGWFPVQGMGSTLSADQSFLERAGEVAYYAVLPVLALATREIGLFTRMTRATMLESLGEDYVMTARAKGLSRRRVNVRHALRNSLLPLTSVLGYRFSHAIGGTILIETVFSWPGLGRLLYESVGRRDNTVILGVFVFLAIAVLVVNLITDLVYGALDPRVRRAR